MLNPKVELSGVHLVRRVDESHDDLIKQKVGMEISDAGVNIALTGLESGQHRPVVSKDPAVIDHYRQLDRAQYSIAVSQRPEVPEPIHIPLDRIPEGMRLCWLCEGTLVIEDEFGGECACVQCKGEGVMPEGGLLSAAG